MIPHFGDHASNERTFLAWVRTVIAIEGFGIAAARLSGTEHGKWLEPSMLAAGVVVVVLAYIRMRFLRQRILHEEAEDDGGTGTDVLLLLLTASLFALVALFSLRMS